MIKITNSKSQTNSKFQIPIFKIAMLLILSILLVPGELDALMPAKRESGGRGISTLQDTEDKEEGFTFRVYDEQEKEIPTEEGADEAMSEEENAAVENKIREEIKRTKEEKRRIIEEVKEKEAFPEFPEPKRPFIAEEEAVESRLSKPKAKMVKPLETHNIMLGERPLLLGLFLLALSVALYYAYKFTIKK